MAVGLRKVAKGYANTEQAHNLIIDRGLARRGFQNTYSGTPPASTSVPCSSPGVSGGWPSLVAR